MLWFLLATGVAIAGLGVVTAWLVFKHRQRRPLTRDEKLAAARAAARAIRRTSRRSRKGVVERGDGIPDRYSGAIVENATYGDAANFDSGGGHP